MTPLNFQTVITGQQLFLIDNIQQNYFIDKYPFTIYYLPAKKVWEI
jgi:hypothetical protein